MKNHLASVTALMLVSAGLVFADEAMGGLCKVMTKIEGVAPIAVKIIASVLLVAGLVAGGFMVIDRERNLMGRGIVVGALAIVFFAILWALAEPIGGAMTALKTALGC